MKIDYKNAIKTIITAILIGCVGFFVISWVLSPFFSGSFTLPQHVSLGAFRVQFYGAIIALAAAVGYWLALRRRVQYGIEKDDADVIILAIVIAGFVGARLYHVISEFGFYADNLLGVFAVWNGGLSIFGAGIGGVIAIYVYVRYTSNYSILHLLDWLTPSVVVGQIIGRFGNFMNYELYGSPTSLPWKMFIPVHFRTPPYELIPFYHPLFLYEAAGSVIIFILLLKLKLGPGYLFLLWLFLYNVMRFLLEQIRIGSVIYGGIRVNAIVSIIIAALAIFIWLKLRKQYDIQTSPHM